MLIRIGDVLVNSEVVKHIRIVKLRDRGSTVVVRTLDGEELYCCPVTEDVDALKEKYRECLNALCELLYNPHEIVADKIEGGTLVSKQITELENERQSVEGLLKMVTDMLKHEKQDKSV